MRHADPALPRVLRLQRRVTRYSLQAVETIFQMKMKYFCFR